VGIRPSPVRTSSVSRDWRAPLSDEKSRTYLSNLRSLEIAYAMFSVNLDEAFGLRRQGKLACAYQVLSVSPPLCKRLSSPLQSLLRAMNTHAKHFGTTPSPGLLDPENFQTARSRRAATLSSLCGRVFLSQRSQFLHKISVLQELIEDLCDGFGKTASELGEGLPLNPDTAWEMLDAAHYDINTCLRECIVAFKCFLLVLPDKELTEFRSHLQKDAFTQPGTVLTEKRHLAHRRIALLKGQ
jgi:hypothetical protein